MNFRGTFKRPAVMWTALAFMLLMAALFVPVKWVETVQSVVGEPAPAVDAFTPAVARVDKALAAGEAPGVGQKKLVEFTPHLQVRRLMNAGPLTHEEVRKATKMLREFDAEIASQKLAGSREAVRHERNRRLAKAFPRLDAQKLARELSKLRGELGKVGLAGL